TEVQGGSRLVAEAADKIASMQAAITENTTALQAIARDSHEQALSIDEVNSSVRTLDEATQHNAALVEEINAAIEQTEAQATELDRVVDIFTVSTSGKPAVAATPANTQQPVGGVRGLQNKLKAVAGTYLRRGSNAAEKADWAEF